MLQFHAAPSPVLSAPESAPAAIAIPLTQVQRDLLATADLLERDGWVQGEFGPGRLVSHGARCVLGALGAVTVGSGDPCRDDLHQRYQEARRRIARGCGRQDPMYWNDARSRQKDEVISMLRTWALEEGS